MQNNHLITASNICELSQHTQILKDWSLAYHQISSGKFESYLNEICFDGIQIYEERLKPSVFQKGEGKENCLCLGVFSQIDQPALWMGKELDQKQIISIYDGGDILMRTPENSYFYSLTIPLDLLSDQDYKINASLANDSLICNDKSYNLYNDLYKIMNMILSHPFSIATKNTRTQVKSEILDLTYAYLDALDRYHRPLKKVDRKARQVVSRALEFIDAHKDKVLSIDELCQITFTSRRTLQNCFEQVTGQSPALFLKQLRLNSVRKILAQSEEPVVISNIAMDWGFWHLSQFSADYKKLFCETPSQTLNSNRKLKNGI